MKIIALVGSIREKSYNMQLMRTMKDRYQDKFDLELANMANLPYFNQDQELDPPEIVKSFKKQIADADAVLIITPEYNWSIPGILKNALDWLSRGDKVLINKPVMIAGVATGLMGTIRAQLQLRQMLDSPGLSARVLRPAGNEIVITQAAQKFDESGRLADQATLDHIDNVLQKFLNMI